MFCHCHYLLNLGCIRCQFCKSSSLVAWIGQSLGCKLQQESLDTTLANWKVETPKCQDQHRPTGREKVTILRKMHTSSHWHSQTGLSETDLLEHLGTAPLMGRRFSSASMLCVCVCWLVASSDQALFIHIPASTPK